MSTSTDGQNDEDEPEDDDGWESKMNNKGIVPVILIVGIVAGILVFIALAAVGVGLFDFLKKNFVFILIIALGYVILFKPSLWKGLLKVFK